jgi:hypothetical protein
VEKFFGFLFLWNYPKGASTGGRNPNKTGPLFNILLYTNQLFCFTNNWKIRKTQALGFPTTQGASRPVNLVNEYANEPASWPSAPSAHHGGTITGNLDLVLCVGRAWNLNARGLFERSVVGQYWELGVLIGLILLESIYIFQNVLFAKYVPRFYGITSILKQKIVFSQLYIHDMTQYPGFLFGLLLIWGCSAVRILS